MHTVYDEIIIGSGFGGSVAAYHLAKKNRKVLLLERGPWRDTRDTRMMGIAHRSALPSGRYFYTHIVNRLSAPWLPKSGIRLNKKGLFDIHYDKDMSIVCSSGVGGGSHVYSAMNVRPAVSGYWNGHAAGISEATMEPHYQWIINKMGAQVPSMKDNIPNFVGQRYADSEHFIADKSIEQPAMSINFSEGAENFKNNSFFGSANSAKATLDVVLIGPAMKAGLELIAEQECKGIYRIDSDTGHSNTYRLEVLDHTSNTLKYYLTKKVILAAGALNTQRILNQSCDNGGLTEMPALGKGFGGNGDFPAYWAVNEKDSDLSIGTPTHGRFELRNYQSSMTKNSISDCPNLTEYGLNGIDGVPLPSTKMRKRLKSDLILVGMGADTADGVFTWNKGRLRTRYIQKNSPIFKELINIFKEITRRTGKKVWFTDKRLLTVHPLGGARLSNNSQAGVINSMGEVYGNPGLYIVDASALPAAPGSPPSMTIAAWSRHVSQNLRVGKKPTITKNRQNTKIKKDTKEDAII